MQEFAAFTSDTLCRTEERNAIVAETLPKLNQLLSTFHVEAETILITQVMFGIEYEKKLQQKLLDSAGPDAPLIEPFNIADR